LSKEKHFDLQLVSWMAWALVQATVGSVAISTDFLRRFLPPVI